LSELEPLLAFFASFVLGRRLMEQLARWDMIILEEFPRYQEISRQKVLERKLRGSGDFILPTIPLSKPEI
jgi:hypothetical protein